MTRAAPALLLAALLWAATACGDGVRRYEARGVVREVRPEWNQVVIAHEDIPGLMSAMTMNFDVADPALLRTLTKGQAIAFTVEFTGRSYRVVAAQPLGRGEDGEAPTLQGVLDQREPAPDFALRDQSGAPVSLRSLRGRTLLVDFVYTSCRGPCPILTARHVELERSLAPALRERTHFVSISLDPARDTPEALRAYAVAHGADLDHWSFLTGPVDAVADVVQRFGVGTVRKPDGEVDHLVVTFLVDPQGRIAERYVGLEHDAETLRSDLERVAAG